MYGQLVDAVTAFNAEIERVEKLQNRGWRWTTRRGLARRMARAFAERLTGLLRGAPHLTRTGAPRASDLPSA